jgi:hypothetical protein
MQYDNCRLFFMNFLCFVFGVKKLGIFKSPYHYGKNIQILMLGLCTYVWRKFVCLVGHIHEWKKFAWN